MLMKGGEKGDGVQKAGSVGDEGSKIATGTLEILRSGGRGDDY